MKIKYLNQYIFTAIALFLLGVGNLAAAQSSFIYEERNAAEEKKRYLVKLEQDKRKCELAIINTKTLIARSKNRPYLPELQIRLAELYIEKSRIVYFLRVHQQESGQERALEQYEANTLKQQAIEIYQRILNDFPDYKDRDKVHFFLAHEFYELGQTKEMVDQYALLIKTYPQSIYTPEAHLLLGDYYFNQKQDVEKSKDHYEAVLNHPDSPATAAARYKLAWCRINLVDYAGALKLFEESVLSPLAAKDLDIDTYRRVDVRLESLTDMAFCYPEVYKKTTPEQDLAYFKRFAWSRPVYTAVLEKLAYRYYVKKKWAKTASLYRELADLRQDPEKLIEYAKYIFESTQALGTYQHAERDVQIIVHALEIRKYSVHISTQTKENLINDFEIFTRDIITHLHANANRTNSRQDFKIAAEAYKHYLDFFTQSPAAGEMAQNYAEALFSSDQYLEAGKQYEKITPVATQNTKKRQEMLYSAVISYYQALKQKDDLNYYQAAFAREGLRSAGNQYVNEYDRSPYAPEVQFNVAWAAYDAGQYDAAINDFSNFIDSYPNHKATKAAVHLVLDAFHLMENYQGLIRCGKSLLRDGKLRDQALVKEVAQIVRSAESKVVSTMTMAALDDWESARQELMQVADQGNAGEMGEQALNALVISSRDNKDLATLFYAVNKLAQSYPRSPHVKDGLGIAIDTALKIGQYRVLADYLENFTGKFPADPQAPDLLLQAARIREGLGQYAASNRDYRKFLSMGKATQPQLDDVVFSMLENAHHLKNKGVKEKILSRYAEKLSALPGLRADAELAVLNYQANRRSQASRLSKKVKKAYQAQMGEKAPELRDRVAELYYYEVYLSSGPYFNLRLKNKIDNAVVARKAKLLQQLEQGYQKVMAAKSPDWALKACFRANELNREFAEFLIRSPLPEGLNAQQTQQYRQLIRQKAQAYQDKADQYVKTCIELARKWEICDPRLASYFTPAEQPQGRDERNDSLAAGKSSTEISLQALKHQALLAIYRKMISGSENPANHLALARAYLKQGDYRQAFLAAQNGLTKLKNGQDGLEVDLLNLIGLTHLYCGQDREAKEAFKKALGSNPQSGAARVNLAGLYHYYGHHDKALELVRAMSTGQVNREDVHPRTGALYNEYSMQTN